MRQQCKLKAQRAAELVFIEIFHRNESEQKKLPKGEGAGEIGAKK